MPLIYLLHENPEWVAPLTQALSDLELPFEEWSIAGDRPVPRAEEAPHGVFYSRMSASAHTRGHTNAAEYTRALLGWLERHGRRVINGSRALELELSKELQARALERAGIPTPRTVYAGAAQLGEVIEAFGITPFILKPNRGGRGVGVARFESIDEAVRTLPNLPIDTSVDGTWLVQEYIQAPTPTIRRAEFIGGKLKYVVEVDTATGFERCPADACAVGAPVPFRIDLSFEAPILDQLRDFFADQGIATGSAEFIESTDRGYLVYDINVTSNYNRMAEAGVVEESAYVTLAKFLGRELERVGTAQVESKSDHTP